MNLRNFDNKIIRLEDIFGDVYEGICMFNDREYNEHEYGKDEDSLQMSYIMFFKSTIKKVEVIDDFTDKYGYLEEVVFDSGMDLIDEVLDSEDDISIYRMLLCLEDKISSFPKDDIPSLIISLENVIKYNEDQKNIGKAKELLDIIKK